MPFSFHDLLFFCFFRLPLHGCPNGENKSPHNTNGERDQSTLGTCPSLLGPYLRTFNAAMLEARPTYHLLQTYSLVSVLLREVPVVSSLSSAAGDSGNAGQHALIATVMPTALNKKELTRGVLSGNSLLQAVTMDLMASILDRFRRVIAAQGSPATPPGPGSELTSLLRQRMPEVQTLLGLRDKIGGSGSRGNGGGSGDVRVVALKWRLLSLLDRYAVVLPAAVSAARFDFLKLLPSALLLASPRTPKETETDEANGGAAATAEVHPLVQLVTLQLLSREGVVGVTSSGGIGIHQQSHASSGWLSHKPTTTTTTGASADSSTATENDAADKTPLGMVLRVALDATTSPATRDAARALAGRALVSLGVVPPPPAPMAGRKREDPDNGGKEDEGEEDGVVVEGEAGVWLDALALNPGAVGALVMLARESCDHAHALMAAGIRAAERGMQENGLLRSAAAAGGGNDDGDDGEDDGSFLEGDWEVEFRWVSLELRSWQRGVVWWFLQTRYLEKGGGAEVGEAAVGRYCSSFVETRLCSILIFAPSSLLRYGRGSDYSTVTLCQDPDC